MDEAAVRGVLRDNGLKATPRRLAVAALMLRRGRALTPDEVHDRLRPGLGRLGRQTVYRILEELAGAGLLTRVERDDRFRCYAACTAGEHHHHHIVCTGCGRVEVVSCSFPARQRSAIERSTGFRVTGHSMQVEGVCPGCRERKRG